MPIQHWAIHKTWILKYPKSTKMYAEKEILKRSQKRQQLEKRQKLRKM